MIVKHIKLFKNELLEYMEVKKYRDKVIWLNFKLRHLNNLLALSCSYYLSLFQKYDLDAYLDNMALRLPVDLNCQWNCHMAKFNRKKEKLAISI